MARTGESAADAAERAADAAERAASGANRVFRAWRKLPPERRLAAYSAVGLFLALFLPWYQETVIASGRASRLQSVSATITGWGAFSFVEAVVLTVAAAVLIVLFRRAEGRGPQLAGGDGWLITGAGICTCLLIVWRIFDKQGTTVHGPGATASGIEWGIFVALAIAALLTYTGSRIRAAERGRAALAAPAPAPPRPPTPPPATAGGRTAAEGRPTRRRRPAAAPRPLSADDPQDARTARLSRPPSPPKADGGKGDGQLAIPFESRRPDE